MESRHALPIKAVGFAAITQADDTRADARLETRDFSLELIYQLLERAPGQFARVRISDRFSVKFSDSALQHLEILARALQFPWALNTQEVANSLASRCSCRLYFAYRSQ